MPFSFSSSCSSDASCRCWSTRSRTTARHSFSCCSGLRPSTVSSRTRAPICCFRPPMRFMKNSSRLELTIARNFTRSSSGVRSSCASRSTRRLNASQVSSRFRYHSEASRSTAGSDNGTASATDASCCCPRSARGFAASTVSTVSTPPVSASTCSIIVTPWKVSRLCDWTAPARND